MGLQVVEYPELNLALHRGGQARLWKASPEGHSHVWHGRLTWLTDALRSIWICRSFLNLPQQTAW